MRHKATSSSFKTRFATHVSSEPTLGTQPAQNQFALEIDHFADCILNDLTPRTPGEEGLRD
ncbi:hypothetical protein AD935_08810, partial [Gluconobacter japonicus]